MIPECREKSHGQENRSATWDVSEAILQRDTVPGDLAAQRWQTGYVCSRCGCRHGYRLSNGRYQTSVTAGTVLHKTHMPLTQWFLAFYFVSQDKRGNPRFLKMWVCSWLFLFLTGLNKRDSHIVFYNKIVRFEYFLTKLISVKIYKVGLQRASRSGIIW